MSTGVQTSRGRSGLLLSFALLLAACEQDAYRIQRFIDDGSVGEGAWVDAEPIPDGPRRDGDGPGGDAATGDTLSDDACLTQPEACNNVDDNCNGSVDEGFDKLTDPRYCEACKGCMWLLQKQAYPDCVAGACAIKSCVTGYVDLDKQVANGCEYACEPSGVEICDGEDNDCDGTPCTGDGDCTPPGTCGSKGHCVDEGVTLSQSICKDLGPCQGTKTVCKGAQGWVCDYGPDVELLPCATSADCGQGYSCVAGVCPGIVALDEARCDGKDGDCDGVVDDPWASQALQNPLGAPCEPDPTKVGICRPQGVWACDAAGAGVACTQTQAGKSPTDEVCNGLDDDCDGLVDEEQDDSAGKGVVDAMVHVQRAVNGTSYDFYIYAYEAARPDASATASGAKSERACSRQGVLPWGSVSYTEAAAACAASGKRLCTGAEWQVACQGASGTLYPYGATYAAASCNGVDQGSGKPLAAGALASCVGGEPGLHDMSGNLREWTNDKRGSTTSAPIKAIYVVRGGAYHTPSPGLTCDFDLSQAVEDVVLPAVGFRCCSDSAP